MLRAMALILPAECPGEPDQVAGLIRLAKAGDLAAFEQIMRRHERRVLLTALRLLGRLEDAQDAAQEVFLRLYRHLGQFEDGRDFEPWLYRITVNACRDIVRRREAHLSLEEEPAADLGSAEAAVERGDQRRLLEAALKRLPERERAALVLRDIDGLSSREAARILGSSEATVRSQAASARLKVQKYVERWLRRRK